MELKQAMETATAGLDVRPGFVGDVMAGGRRRQTRKLVTLTAVVALVAGATAGVVLTRPSSDDRASGIDARLTAPTAGDLSSSKDDVDRALNVWHNAQKSPTVGEGITDFSMASHVYWIGTTEDGPAAVVVQPVQVSGVPEPKPLVGLVAMGKVVDREVVLEPGEERGRYDLGSPSGTQVVLSLGKRLFLSQDPVRGQDDRLSREWREVAADAAGVAVVSALPQSKPVFVRADSPPRPDDFTAQPVRSKAETGQGRAFLPRSGLGWSTVNCKTESAPPTHSPAQVQEDLQRRALLDFLVGFDAAGSWEACAWTPDGRFAIAFEAFGQLYGALYTAQGTFSAGVVGGPAVKDTAAPVRLALPDGQGTIVADAGTLIGPEQRENVWLAPAGTTEVTVVRNGTPTVVPLP
ncbi:hypothetical protein [Lentzea sp. HUAS12]|uniref:hypothetical protein n=1 Tax=Lentzea sp. HUAS12 TaxID=2951806 RepID=UPI00209F9477|nr:hypothetical protein [Lentzea sp. HUAS12]USX51270.1 hypothetical protein ND450_38900 [Lentzea sp. HUAS12]